jgi:hypothetical protein
MLYNLGESVDIRAAPKNLLQFLADFGISYEKLSEGEIYNDIPTIIKAFFCIFPNRGINGSGEERTNNYADETEVKGGNTIDRLCRGAAQRAVSAASGPQKQYNISEDPAFHIICPYLNYRILSLMMEIQLARISALNANRLLEQRNKLKALLVKGKCGVMSGPEAYAKFMAFLNKTPGSEAGQVDLSSVQQKLDRILELLRGLIGFNIECAELDDIDKQLDKYFEDKKLKDLQIMSMSKVINHHVSIKNMHKDLKIGNLTFQNYQRCLKGQEKNSNKNRNDIQFKWSGIAEDLKKIIHDK